MAKPSTEAAYRGKRVLVTGADGFIGSHLAEALVETGAEVTALALYNAYGTYGWLDEIEDAVRDALRLALGDVRDAPYMRRLADGHDIVFHLAALVGIPYSYAAAQSNVDVNLNGTLNLLEATRAGAIGRFVHTSTSEVYGTAQASPITEAHPVRGQSPYSASKIAADHMAEAFARSFDTPVVVLRPFNTYGPRQSERAVIAATIRQILDAACPEIRLGDLTPSRDLSYVTDIAAAFLAVGVADGVEYGTAYNAGSGTAVSIEETVSLLRQITGSNKKVVSDPERVRPERSEVRALLADSSRLAALTGWKPQTALADGLGRTVEWWRERLSSGRARRETGYAI